MRRSGDIRGIFAHRNVLQTGLKDFEEVLWELDSLATAASGEQVPNGVDRARDLGRIVVHFAPIQRAATLCCWLGGDLGLHEIA